MLFDLFVFYSNSSFANAELKCNMNMESNNTSEHCPGYREVIEALYRDAPSFQNVGKQGYHPGLDMMARFADFLDNPQECFDTVHVAGTNGKGSVAHFLASILSAAGFRTGLYTSPHLLDFRERIKIVDDSGKTCSGPVFKMIPEEYVMDFLAGTEAFRMDNGPSFFEITTAMAMDWFAAEDVDVAVLECGLGGRLDSTNIVCPELSIITSIGFDHKDILGDTLEKIAFEKGGIIKHSVPAVAGALPDEAFEVLSDMASERESPFIYSPFHKPQSRLAERISRLPVGELDLKSEVQAVNLKTVSAAVDVLFPRYFSEVEDVATIMDALRHTARRTGLRGRWETLSLNPVVICDIGHNENALRPVMSQLKDLRDRIKPPHFYMVYGMASDKDILSVAHLLPQDAEYIFTNAAGKRAMPAAALKEVLLGAWGEEAAGSDDRYMVIPSVREAVRYVMERSGPDDLIYIGGSSYVVSEALDCPEIK